MSNVKSITNLIIWALQIDVTNQKNKQTILKLIYCIVKVHQLN